MYGGHSNPNPDPTHNPDSDPSPGPNPNSDPDPDPRYGGHWARGLPHGHGVYCYAGGASFDGEHAEGVRHGAGTPRPLTHILTHPPIPRTPLQALTTSPPSQTLASASHSHTSPTRGPL
eukprot:scaffold67234_cov39-Phaeocystis_antarctica.AAC.2